MDVGSIIESLISIKAVKGKSIAIDVPNSLFGYLGIAVPEIDLLTI